MDGNINFIASLEYEYNWATLCKKNLLIYFFIQDPATQYNSRTCKIQTLYVSFRDLQWQVIAQYYFMSLEVAHISIICLLRFFFFIIIAYPRTETSDWHTQHVAYRWILIFFFFFNSGLDHCAWRLRRLLLQRWMQFPVERAHERYQSRDCSDPGASG